MTRLLLSLVVLMIYTGCKSEKTSYSPPEIKELVKFIDKNYGIRKEFIIPDKFQSFSNISNEQHGFKGEAMFIFVPKKEIINQDEAKKYFKKFYETLDYTMLNDGYFFYTKSSDLIGPKYEMDSIKYYEPQQNTWVEIYKMNNNGDWYYIDKIKNKEGDIPRVMAQEYFRKKK
ncbi:hypothetical protein [Aureibacter tunicatorum]|uniref:Chlorite dismutase n=1 Tax=Aureibacter tunicatorum TaxID=866807 RepID=A0AAE3XK31_9BACT|nr:hypothetical protein [Aureibacter tunicatorum]MDR6237449.1 chlorite dismutase [Aureibacter tunicatorum]BDD06439.1 hypothetical protein AUTU_39220 [Aureibacter tunicatorum]